MQDGLLSETLGFTSTVIKHKMALRPSRIAICTFRLCY